MKRAAGIEKEIAEIVERETRAWDTTFFIPTWFGDGAFAVVDVDTLWRHRNGKEFHWKGRACKVYIRLGAEWKMTMHTGLLEH